MKYVFIGGIPAAGKSCLAEKVAKDFNILHVKIDKLRSDMRKDLDLQPWVDFFWNKDEEKYWNTTTCEEHWSNIRRQSEAFWPVIKKKIDKVVKSKRPSIFEGVNILPHLAAINLNFSGIFLLGESLEVIYERLKKDSRWGRTEVLQRKEAEMFFVCEGANLKKEAEKYGYKSFYNHEEAEKELMRLMKL